MLQWFWFNDVGLHCVLMPWSGTYGDLYIWNCNQSDQRVLFMFSSLISEFFLGGIFVGAPENAIPVKL